MAKSVRPNCQGPALPAPQRAWQRMLSGRRLDLLDPSPVDIEIEDIAHGLARVARWNGQTVGEHAFSVAQHAVLVEQITGTLHPGWSRTWRLAALLHDAPEYVIGDLISPFKAAIGLDYRTFELQLLKVIHLRFGLPPELPAEITRCIKDADRIAAFIEATQLAGFSREEAERYFGRPEQFEADSQRILLEFHSWPTVVAQTRFLERFAALTSRTISRTP
jgi:uncharacterized protein